MKPQDEIAYLKERIKTLEEEVLEEQTWYEKGFSGITNGDYISVWCGDDSVCRNANEKWIDRLLEFPVLVKAVVSHVNAPAGSGRDPMRKVLRRMDIQAHKDGIGGCFYR